MSGTRLRFKVNFGGRRDPEQPGGVSVVLEHTLLDQPLHVVRQRQLPGDAGGRFRDRCGLRLLLGFLPRPRMTQVMNLLGLSPELQERLLTGDLGLGERQLRAVLREVGWEGQGRLLGP